MNQTTTPLVTADELLKVRVPGQRQELVRGELRIMPPAGFDHGALGMNLSTPLDSHVRANQLGVVVAAETGFILSRDPDTVRAPDIGFIARDRVPATGRPRGYWPGAPDLAVEVVSPHDILEEVEDKVDDWLSAGTRMVWVINPRRRTVTVYRSGSEPVLLTANDSLDGQDVVPGFQLPVAAIFQ